MLKRWKLKYCSAVTFFLECWLAKSPALSCEGFVYFFYNMGRAILMQACCRAVSVYIHIHVLNGVK